MRGPEAREQLCFSVIPSFGRRGGWDGTPIPRINSADMVTSNQSPSADMMKAMLRCAMEDGTAVQVAAVGLGPRHRVCRHGHDQEEAVAAPQLLTQWLPRGLPIRGTAVGGWVDRPTLVDSMVAE